jgi:hypothetical protein
MGDKTKIDALPKISHRARRQLARASTIACSKFVDLRMRQRHPVKIITLRTPKEQRS